MNWSEVDIVEEIDEDGDSIVAEVAAETSTRLSVIDRETTIQPCSAGITEQEKLARFIFDCKQMSEERFTLLVNRGLELLEFTEVDLVKTFCVRLERIEAWVFGSYVPHPQMQRAVAQWMVQLAEAKLGN